MMSSIDYSLFIFFIINIIFIANFNKIKFFHYILDKPDKKKNFIINKCLWQVELS